MSLEAQRAGPKADSPEAAEPATGNTSTRAKPTEPWQVMPPLTVEEFAALRDGIAADGVLVPITVDQHGTVIDGHHRQHIADELGIPCPKVVREFTNDEERYEFALGLNLKRRHLTREQMRQLIASECKRNPGATDREIGRRLGCSHRTVAVVRRPQVDNLSTPMSREEAEELTERIRRSLDRFDQDCIDLLADGVPPAMLAGQIKDAEDADAVWRHIVGPRVTAILGWP
jgi:hypothetical protein